LKLWGPPQLSGTYAHRHVFETLPLVRIADSRISCSNTIVNLQRYWDVSTFETPLGTGTYDVNTSSRMLSLVFAEALP